MYSLLLLYGVTIYAQDTLSSGKIITNVQLVGIGTVNQLDTYLSPSEYTGTEIRYISHTLRENGTSLLREIIHQAHLSYTHNASNKKQQYRWNVQLSIQPTLCIC